MLFKKVLDVASSPSLIQLNEKEPLNYVGKGYVRVLQNNMSEAKTLFEKVLKDTKSKNVAVLDGIAEAYLSNKQSANEALPLLLKAKSVDKKDVNTLILLGDAYLQQNNGGQAVSAYEDAATLDPKNGKPNYKIGNVFARSKNISASTEAYNKAIAADPEFTLAYKELGEIYYIAKDGAKAVEAQKKYLSLTEKPEQGRLQLAFYLFMAKNYAEANALFATLIQSPDALPVTYRFYAVSLMESKDLANSRKVFEQYFAKAKPEELQASDYNYYGNALLSLNEDSLAIASGFDKSLALDSTQTEILQLKAETLFKDKRYAEAGDAYAKLAAARPSPAAKDYYDMGRAYYYGSKMVEADSAFSKLVKLQPEMTIGYTWKARTLASQDPELKQGLAKPYFDKVVELGSATPEKNKNDLIEAYNYLASYSYNVSHDVNATKSYYQKILTLKPGDPTATENLSILKKIEAKKKP
jgi:tetratricopeptide (TPR) repeat protein